VQLISGRSIVFITGSIFKYEPDRDIQTGDKQTGIEIKFEGDTSWLTQYQLSESFKGSRSNIVEHIKNIYKTGELDENSTCRKFRQVRIEGKRK
ncbi:MAG: hypothetical protein ACRDEB_04795, partial [Chitinophagaceae bacterium]